VLVRCVAIALHSLSLLVPEAGGRDRWRTRWARSLGDYVLWLESRGLPKAAVRKLLLRYLSDGAAEAFSSRWPAPVIREGTQRRLRSPWVALVLPLTVLALGLWWSHGVSLLRTAWRPLAPAAGDRLVTAVPERSFFGKAHGFTPRQFYLVQTRTKSYSTIAGYAIRLQNIDGRLRRIALVTPGLFGMLGMTEGQVYVTEQLGPEWLGRSIQTGGRSYRVTGVWPRDFRPALMRPDFWIPETPDRLDTTMAALLAPGVTLDAASKELRETLLSAPVRKGSGTPTAVVPLRPGPAAILQSLWTGFICTSIGLVCYAIWCASRRHTRRMELFFLAKAVPLMAGVFCCSVAGVGIQASGTAAGPFLVFWLSGIGAVLAIWWARRDQHLRCPRCLARMTLSVQIGSHGAALLEGVGDEVLCEYGHGSLWLPGTAAQGFGPEVWRSQ
jgi:hypothetical protein